MDPSERSVWFMLIWDVQGRKKFLERGDWKNRLGWAAANLGLAYWGNIFISNSLVIIRPGRQIAECRIVHSYYIQVLPKFMEKYHVNIFRIRGCFIEQKQMKLFDSKMQTLELPRDQIGWKFRRYPQFGHHVHTSTMTCHEPAGKNKVRIIHSNSAFILPQIRLQ